MNTEEIVIDCVRQRLRESSMECVAEEIELSKEINLKDLDLDSLDYVELATDLEHRFADCFLCVSENDLVRFKTIGRIIEFVESQA